MLTFDQLTSGMLLTRVAKTGVYTYRVVTVHKDYADVRCLMTGSTIHINRTSVAKYTIKA